MSTFVLKREYALQLPNIYVEIDRDEMEYVDGGGTLSFTITAGTIAGIVGGGLSKVAVTAALRGISVKIGAALIFGTAGWGTLIAAAAVAAFNVAIPWLAGLIIQNAVNKYNKSITFNLASAWFIPNYNLTW